MTSYRQLSLHFYDLPAEIRNMIYARVLQDPLESPRGKDDEIDLFIVRQVLYQPALLQVCQQMQIEATPLLEQAVKKFWPDYTLTVTGIAPIFCPFKNSPQIKLASKELLELPHVRICNLSLRCEFEYQSIPRTQRLKVTIKIDDNTGLVVWRCRFPDISHEPRRADLEAAEARLARTLRNKAGIHAMRRGASYSLKTAKGGIDLESCVCLVYKIPWFKTRN